MFAHIRRHQKWLWLFISAAVIISFVWYFNPNQQMGAGSVLTDDGGTSTLSQGPAPQSALVQVEPYVDAIPRVTAFTPPISEMMS